MTAVTPKTVMMIIFKYKLLFAQIAWVIIFPVNFPFVAFDPQDGLSGHATLPADFALRQRRRLQQFPNFDPCLVGNLGLL